MLNDVWHSAVIDFGCVSSKISGLISSFLRLKFGSVWGSAPMKEMVKKGRGSGMTWTGMKIE